MLYAKYTAYCRLILGGATTPIIKLADIVNENENSGAGSRTCWTSNSSCRRSISMACVCFTR